MYLISASVRSSGKSDFNYPHPFSSISKAINSSFTQSPKWRGDRKVDAVCSSRPHLR